MGEYAAILALSMKSALALVNLSVDGDVNRVEPMLTYPEILADVAGHKLKFVFEGAARLQLLLDAIASAQTRLRLYFYAFGIDSAGTAVVDALIEARNRGVAVTLLVDGFGTAEQPDHLFKALAEAGVTFARFQPRYGRRYLLRNHQKMLIVDEALAVVGGSNIEEAYFADDPESGSWHDLYLQIEGDAVVRLGKYYDALAKWIVAPNAGIRSLVALLAVHSDDTGAMRWLFGGPSRRLNKIARALREGILRANQVDMVQAYFAPNWGFLRKLGRVARTGQFRLITAAKSDNNTTIAAARHCYRRLLKRSAQIYEYQPERLHMKLMVIDDVTYIGSANFDMRSLFLNTEILLRIEDSALAGRMRALIDLHCDHSRLIDRESHRANSNWLKRARWLLGYLIVTALDYRLTRNLNWKVD